MISCFRQVFEEAAKNMPPRKKQKIGRKKEARKLSDPEESGEIPPTPEANNKEDIPEKGRNGKKTAKRKSAKMEENMKEARKLTDPEKSDKNPPTPEANDGDATLEKGKSGNKTSKKSSKKETAAKKQASANYCNWLMKSEPESRMEKGVDVKFSFDDLKNCPDQTSCWDGVRNYEARNFMRDQMKIRHEVFFYHSNTKEPGIVGIAKVVKESYIDHTQFDKKDPHYDSSSSKEKPKWMMVDVKYVRPLKRFIGLKELKELHQEHKSKGGPLKDLALFTRSRLSVQPISKEEWDFILQLEDKTQDDE